MKIDSLSPQRATFLRRGERGKRTAAGGFAKELAGESPGTASVSGGSALGPVDALLALQEVPEAGERHARAWRRGSDLLDWLDELRLGLLVGRYPAAKLERLTTLLADQRDRADDPRLAGVIEEIELRAAVELAKLGR